VVRSAGWRIWGTSVSMFAAAANFLSASFVSSSGGFFDLRAVGLAIA
jgi:hypothetical protein